MKITGRSMALVFIATSLVMLTACEPGIANKERQAAYAAGYQGGYAAGITLLDGQRVFFVAPDQVSQQQRNFPIPSYYLHREDFADVKDKERRQEVADAHNWGFYCGFMTAADKPAPECA